MIQLSDYWLTFAIGTVLPILVAFVTKRFAAASFKAAMLAALSAITGVLTSIQGNHGVFHWQAAVASFVVTFITAVAAHYGFLKPTGVTGTDGAVATAVPNGVGTPVDTTDSAGPDAV